MPPTPKKTKLDVRNFQESWTNSYGFLPQKDRAVCALCYESVVCRTSSVQRHFQVKHESSFKNTDEKFEAIKRAVSGFKKQKTFFKQIVGTKNKATVCSYTIAHSLALKGKPFTDGEFVKETFLKSAEVLFDDLPNLETILSRIREIPASARSIERRITDMATNITTKQKAGLLQASVFSVAIDESTDINDVARLAIIVRYCNDDCIYEELCCLVPLLGTTTGQDIFTAFFNYFENQKIDIKKIFCVTTDGARALVGKNKGFIKLLEDRIGHPILKFHCIVHQQSLVAKISSERLNSVMDTVVKIINFIISRSALTHRQFKSLLEEMDSAYTDLTLFNKVRWLSQGKVLHRFVSCLEEIKLFLDEKQQSFPELKDQNWIRKLMFLCDITQHLNDLNLRLQGKGQTVLELFENWKEFILKLNIFWQDISTETYKYFPNVKMHSNRFTVNKDEFQNYIKTLKEEFSKRCEDFQAHESIMPFIIKPDLIDLELISFDLNLFKWMEIDDFEMQLIKLRSSELWKMKFVELRKTLQGGCSETSTTILNCWCSLPDARFSSLKKVACALISAFGSTYLCEQIFSHMKIILNPHRSRLTTDRSEACVKLKVTNYKPDVEQLSKDIQGQGSH